MKFWPFTREKRSLPSDYPSGNGSGYTDIITAALLASAAGRTQHTATTSAAIEAAAGAYGSAFGVADIKPDVPLTQLLSPAVLVHIARQLIRRGEMVYVLDIQGNRPTLTPCVAWDVFGKAKPYWYRVDISHPDGTETRMVSEDSVLHFKYATNEAEPWRGLSPLGFAISTGQLYSLTEKSLQSELSGPVADLLPYPIRTYDGSLFERDMLEEKLRTAQGRAVLVPSYGKNSDGQQLVTGNTGGDPRIDWQPQHLGPNPPLTSVSLRNDLAKAVLACCQVPVELVESADGTAQREAWRRFLFGPVTSLGRLVAEEAAIKLDVSGLSFDFRRLAAADIAGRARAYQSMTGAGMDKDKAERLAGLTDD